MTAKIRASGVLADGSAARGVARRALWRFAPAYARHRSRKVAAGVAIERLEGEFEQLRKRHGEQIERLEDLVRELVVTAEELRRKIAEHERRDEV